MWRSLWLAGLLVAMVGVEGQDEVEVPICMMFPYRRGGTRVMESVAALIAVDHVNGRNCSVVAGCDAYIAPGLKLHATLLDTEASPKKAVKNAQRCVEEGVVAIAGPALSSASSASSLLASANDLLTMSGSSTSASLSSASSFPLFSRTAVTDKVTGRGLAGMVKRMAWRRVIVLHSSDAYGIGYQNDFSAGARLAGVEEVLSQQFEPGDEVSMRYAVQVVKDSGAQVIIAVVTGGDADTLLFAADDVGLFEPQYVWVATDGLQPVAAVTSSTDPPRMRRMLDGVVGLTVDDGSGPPYDNLYAAVHSFPVDDFWSVLDPVDRDNLPYTKEDAAEGLKSSSLFFTSTFVHDAVWSIAHAISRTIVRRQDEGMTLQDAASSVGGAALFDEITNVASAATPEASSRGVWIGNFSVAGASGTVRFAPSGDRDEAGVQFAIRNFQAAPEGAGGEDRFVDVAVWTPGVGLTVLVGEGTGKRFIWRDGQEWPSIPSDGLPPKECPPGQFYDVGEEDCALCPRGFVSLEGGGFDCDPCPAGQHNPNLGAVACVLCDEASYSVSPGQTECTPCPDFTFGKQGSTSLEDCRCLPGYFHPQGLSGDNCTECPPGARCEGDSSLPEPIENFGLYEGAVGQVFSCPGGLSKSVCLGAGGCSIGREGALCSRCSKGYFRLARDCLECPSQGSGVLVLAWIGVICVFLVILRTGASHFKTLYVLFTYLQTVSFIGGMRLPYPQSVVYTTRWLALVNFSLELVIPTCERQPSYPTVFIGYAVLPAAIVALDMAINQFSAFVRGVSHAISGVVQDALHLTGHADGDAGRAARAKAVITAAKRSSFRNRLATSVVRRPSQSTASARASDSSAAPGFSARASDSSAAPGTAGPVVEAYGGVAGNGDSEVQGFIFADDDRSDASGDGEMVVEIGDIGVGDGGEGAAEGDGARPRAPFFLPDDFETPPPHPRSAQRTTPPPRRDLDLIRALGLVTSPDTAKAPASAGARATGPAASPGSPGASPGAAPPGSPSTPPIVAGVRRLPPGATRRALAVVPPGCGAEAEAGGKAEPEEEVDGDLTLREFFQGDLLVVLRLMYMPIAARCFSMVKCTPVKREDGGDTSFLTADPDVECWTGEHMRMFPLVVLCFLVYIIGIPAYYAYIMRYTGRLYSKKHLRMYGNLYGRFEHPAYFWELIVTLRKVALVAVKVLLDDARAEMATATGLKQGFATMAVITISLLAHFFMRAFKDTKHDLLESVTLGACWCHVCFGLLMNECITLDNTDELDAYKVMWFIALGISLALSFASLIRDARAISGGHWWRPNAKKWAAVARPSETQDKAAGV